jgi:hypothetical protein
VCVQSLSVLLYGTRIWYLQIYLRIPRPKAGSVNGGVMALSLLPFLNTVCFVPFWPSVSCLSHPKVFLTGEVYPYQHL